jgi:CDP-diacylglycerol--glycerol-3-phosphate 3-phosphatidyltransferase
MTVPNVLSFYRLAMAPVLIVLALTEERTLFIVLLCVSFATDVLDGFIARTWNLCTPLGARLDSIADELTYLAALVGVFQFEYEAVKPHLAILYIFIGFLALAALIPMVKFRKMPSFHLYSFKANALFQGIFIVTLFVFGFNIQLYYFVMGFGILACLEAIIVSLVIDQPISNARSLFWVLGKRNRAP